MDDADGAVRVTRRANTACADCPLRKLKSLRNFTPDELAFVQRFKVGETRLAAGRTVLTEGERSPYLFTVLSGWAFKHKLLDDGRRQIINYALPGDLLGLQGAVFEKMQHNVEALTDVVLCAFDKSRLWELYEKHAGLGFDLTWISAHEKSILADFLVTVGQRTASERMAFVLHSLFRRARSAGLITGRTMKFPLTQVHIADTIGFSLVHTNKTLNRLRRRASFDWTGQEFTMLDEQALAELALRPVEPPGPRPFI